MNFKKQILEALKAKFPDLGEASLNRMADKLAKTVTKEEEVATSVEGVTIQQVFDNYADSRAVEASQTAVTNYEKKHNVKDGKVVAGGPPKEEPKIEEEPKLDENTPAWAKPLFEQNKALIEQNKALAGKVAAIEGSKTSDVRKQALEKKLENVDPKLKTKLLKDFDKMQFSSDEEFDAFMTDTENDLGDMLKAKAETTLGAFGKPVVASGGTDAKATKEEVADVVNELL